MNYGPLPIHSDSESLQTDVMRFMAIIGFCLIAILALVKEAAPVRAATPSPSAPAEVRMTEQITPIEESAIAEPLAATVQVTEKPPEPSASTTSPLPPEQSPAPAPRWQQPLEKPTTEITAARPTPKPKPKPRPIAAAAPAPTPVPRAPAIPPAPDPQPVEAPAEEAGLSLRFASDGDFLRLITKGDIRVYAYAPVDHTPADKTMHASRDILILDADYQFRSSPAPGKVYELLPETIPALVVNALRNAGRDAGTFTWAIVLPGRIEAQIGRHLEPVKSAQLLIDPFGEVQHVAPT